MSDTAKIMLISIVTLLFVSGIIMIASDMFANNNNNQGVLAVVTAGIVIGGAALLIGKLVKTKKDGYPLQDERIRGTKTQAAATTFYVSLYWLLAIMMFTNVAQEREGWPVFDVEVAIGYGIIGMAILFGIFYLYYSRRGQVR